MVMATVLRVLVLSMCRRGVHRYFIIVLAAPVILSIALPTILHGTSFLNTLAESFENGSVAVMTTHGGGFEGCYPVKIVGSAVYGGIELPLLTAPKTILPEHALDFKVAARDCSNLSVPQHLYTAGEDVVLGNADSCPTYTHKGVEAVIMFVDRVEDSTAMMCIASVPQVLETAYVRVRNALLDKLSLWLVLLAVSHTPILYIAVSRALDLLRDDVSALFYVGIGRVRLTLSTAIAMSVLALAIQIFLASITIVYFNTLSSFINIYRLYVQPVYSLWTSAVMPIVTLATFASSVALCGKVIKHA